VDGGTYHGAPRTVNGDLRGSGFVCLLAPSGAFGSSQSLRDKRNHYLERYPYPMDIPDYMMCLECGSPCYVFEFEGERLVEAVCAACGNEELPLFVTPEEFEEQTTGG